MPTCTDADPLLDDAADLEHDSWCDDSPCLERADRPAESAPARFLVPHPATFKNYQCCPWATSRIVIDVETGAPKLCPVTCKRWGCAYCAPRKIKRLAFLTKGAAPNRWIRLGVQPAQYESPEAAWRDTSPKVPELCRKIKILYGECEYLRVAEIHPGTKGYEELKEPGKAAGFPHYHALLRSSFIPQKKLSEIWGDLTGAPVVWIAKIDQTFSSFRYLTKYLTKLHRLEWTDRHVSYSRNFFREEDREKIAWPKHDLVSVSAEHPWQYVASRYSQQSVALREDGSFLLPEEEDPFPLEVTLQDLNLRAPYIPPPPVRPQQKSFAGADDWQRQAYDDQPF